VHQPGPANRARLPPPGAGGHAAEIYGGSGGGFRGPPAPRLRLQVHTGSPTRSRPAPAVRRALAQPRSPAWPFFSIHADAQCRRRRRRQRGRRRRLQPPGLAGGRGAGTFPRPAARAAHRRRCRRGPGARPGQSGRAGRGGAAATGGLCPSPASRASPPPAHRRLRLLLFPRVEARRRPDGAPAEPTHRRGAKAGAGGGGEVRPCPEPLPRPSPERLPISGVRSRIGRREAVAWEPRPPPLRPLARLPYSPALPRALGRGSAWERDG
jgi:hypothetical protein